MEKNIVLPKIYSASTGMVAAVLLLACIVCNWPAVAVCITAMASLIIGLPAMLSLHILLCLSQKLKLEGSFVWTLLLASIPLLAFIVAWLFAGYVPGKTWFILLLGMSSAYAGILTNGISIAQLFNSTRYEHK